MTDLRTIYDQMATKVFNLALQYVQNTKDAEEITQDVFVTVFEKQGQFKGNAAIETWIYRITINKSLDFIKHKKRLRRWGKLLSFGITTEEIPDFNHPGVKLEEQEALEFVFTHINNLPEQQKTALILSKIEHLSHAETAAIMGISTKAVESLLGRAKENLKKKL